MTVSKVETLCTAVYSIGITHNRQAVVPSPIQPYMFKADSEEGSDAEEQPIPQRLEYT